MSEPARQSAPGRPRPWWKSTWALALWALLGTSWFWGWLPYGAFHRLNEHYEESKRKQLEGEDYGLLADLHSALAKEVSSPARMRELAGVPAADLQPETTCTLAWTDDDRPHVAALRAWDAQPGVGWAATTHGGQAVAGRYTMKLWYEECNSEHAGFYPMECTRIAKLRLVERHTAAPKGGPGIGILPGQCVLGAVDEAQQGTVATYAIHLPAHKNVTVRLYTIPAALALRPRLFLKQVEIAQVQGRYGVFPTQTEGDYELRLDRDPRFPDPHVAGQYSVQAHWGKAAGQRCPIPSFDGRDCYHPRPARPVLDAGAER
jgi:hypothetical protein